MRLPLVGPYFLRFWGSRESSSTRLDVVLFPLGRPLHTRLLFRLYICTPTTKQISELTSFLNSRRVPYEVREWKVGDYGWVVQPDAGNRPSAGEVSLVARRVRMQRRLGRVSPALCARRTMSRRGGERTVRYYIRTSEVHAYARFLLRLSLQRARQAGPGL